MVYRIAMYLDNRHVYGETMRHLLPALVKALHLMLKYHGRKAIISFATINTKTLE